MVVFAAQCEDGERSAWLGLSCYCLWCWWIYIHFAYGLQLLWTWGLYSNIFLKIGASLSLMCLNMLVLESVKKIVLKPFEERWWIAFKLIFSCFSWESFQLWSSYSCPKVNSAWPNHLISSELDYCLLCRNQKYLIKSNNV
jgi:hypothetical protein